MRDFLSRDLASLNAVLAGLPRPLADLRIDVVDNARAAEAAPVWRMEASGIARFRFHQKTWSQHPAEIFGRWLDLLPLITAILAAGPVGSCVLNLGDEGHRAGLAFDAIGAEYTLIPDFCFIQTEGYASLARRFEERAVPWQDRRPVLFWRGTTTGLETDLQALPRVKLCQVARLMGPDADVGFSAATQRFAGAGALLAAQGLLRPAVPNDQYDTYQLHVDIDGNSSPWTGFAKLHSGSPVLKVTSPRGYRQWYYDRLVPWVNFVPIRSDLADLAETVKALLADPARAQSIGAAGRELARSMSCDAEIARTVPIALRAFQP